MPSEHTQARCCAHIAPRGPVFHVRRSTDCNGFQMRINTLKLSGDPRAEGKTAEAMGRRTDENSPETDSTKRGASWNGEGVSRVSYQELGSVPWKMFQKEL